MQAEFNFAATPPIVADGLLAWREQFQRQQTELGKALGLPIGSEVEVWLQGGIRLRGHLNFAGENLINAGATLENTRFEIGRTKFTYTDIESCVRL